MSGRLHNLLSYSGNGQVFSLYCCQVLWIVTKKSSPFGWACSLEKCWRLLWNSWRLWIPRIEVWNGISSLFTVLSAFDILLNVAANVSNFLVEDCSVLPWISHVSCLSPVACIRGSNAKVAKNSFYYLDWCSWQIILVSTVSDQWRLTCDCWKVQQR